MRSFLSWVGGKSLLADKIVKGFPAHQTYVEVFGGAGWVLFKKQCSDVEVYNDLNGDLANLFRVVKYRRAELVERFNLVLYSRETYYKFLDGFKRGELVEDEIDKALRFYYLIKSSFGSTVTGGWGFSKKGRPRTFNLDVLTQAAARLEKVYIENKDFDFILTTYDSPETLFYLDPPYTMTKGKQYQYDLNEDGHERLRDRLKNVQGKVIVSYNDSDLVKKLYKGFKIVQTAPVRYSVNNRAGAKLKAPRELLITNF